MTSDGVFDINSISNSDATGITVTITAYTLGDGTSYSNREVVGTSSEVSFTLNITPSCYYSPKIADSSEFVDAMNKAEKVVDDNGLTNLNFESSRFAGVVFLLNTF
jgi:hypothetical protein